MGRKTDKGFSVGHSLSQLSFDNYTIRDRPLRMGVVNRDVINIKSYISDKQKRIKKEYPKNDFHKIHPLSHPSYAPVSIPVCAKCKIENDKKGYVQTKYTWARGNYKYEARWHTKTSNAPKNGQSWIVTRKIPGIGYGPEARTKVEQILVGREWVSIDLWKAAKSARVRGTATEMQNKLLDMGHHRPKRRKK